MSTLIGGIYARLGLIEPSRVDMIPMDRGFPPHRFACLGVNITAPHFPRRFLGSRSPATSIAIFVPVAGCGSPFLSRCPQRFSRKALPLLPSSLHSCRDRGMSERDAVPPPACGCCVPVLQPLMHELSLLPRCPLHLISLAPMTNLLCFRRP